VENDIYETWYINKLHPVLNKDKVYTYESSRYDKAYLSPCMEEKIKEEQIKEFMQNRGVVC
jgi:hypothetical protein